MNNSSSDVQAQRDLIKTEIVEELRRQHLKKELLDEIEKRSKAARLAGFVQHPAVLLLLGFVLTGIVGAWLSARWQSRERDRQQFLETLEWNRQQSRLIQIRNIDHKYEVIDEITKAVGESNGAASEILLSFNPKAAVVPQKSSAREHRLALWRQANEQWHKALSVIYQRLNVFFRNSQIVEQLTRIGDQADLVFFNLLDLIDRAGENQKEIEKEKEEFERIAFSTKHLINSRTNALRELVALMIKEIQEDIG